MFKITLKLKGNRFLRQKKQHKSNNEPKLNMDVTADEDDDGLRTINLKKIWPILSRSVVRDVAPVTHVQLDKVFFS